MNETVRSYAVFAAVAVPILVAAGVWLRGRRKSPDQIEQERRIRISEIGRITDGTVIDVKELSDDAAGLERQMLLFEYDVAGVGYEASQDVTTLRHRIDLHSCRSGLMTSVKYDPSNPGDSIVIAENWTGLRL